MPGSPVKPAAQAAQLDDLLNPFAVLGLENKKPASSPVAAQHPTGAGWASPRSATTAANPYAMGMGAPQPQQYQATAAAPSFQQAGGWGASPQSAFQPPAAINTSPIASPVPFPGAMAAVSPAASYGAPSPAYGAYSPASPAFMSGPTGYATSSPMAMASSPLNRSGAASPAVTDADLALFAAPVVAVKKPPVASPTPAASAPVAPQQAPAPAQAPQQQAGWAATATPQVNDGWDNDDFGIAWEQREFGFGVWCSMCASVCPIHSRSP